jgi:hypothetical protein
VIIRSWVTEGNDALSGKRSTKAKATAAKAIPFA